MCKMVNKTYFWTHTDSYHSPPQGISVVPKLGGAVAVDCIFLCQVDKVRGEDQAQKANVQGSDQLLK